MKYVNETEVLKNLKSFVAKHPTVVAAAKKIGVEPTVMYTALTGKNTMPKKIAKKLGFTQIRMYVQAK